MHAHGHRLSRTSTGRSRTWATQGEQQAQREHGDWDESSGSELAGPSSLPFRLGSAALGASLTFHLVHVHLDFPDGKSVAGPFGSANIRSFEERLKAGFRRIASIEEELSTRMLMLSGAFLSSHSAVIGPAKYQASPPKFSPYYLTEATVSSAGLARRSAQDALAGSVADLVLTLELPDEGAPIEEAIERLKLVQSSLSTLQLSQEESECRRLFATVLLQWVPLLERDDCVGTSRSVISHLLGSIAAQEMMASLLARSKSYQIFTKLLHSPDKSYPTPLSSDDLKQLRTRDPATMRRYQNRKIEFIEPFLHIRNRFLGFLTFPEYDKHTTWKECEQQMVGAFQGLHGALKTLAKIAREDPTSQRIACSAHTMFLLQTMNMKLVIAYHLARQAGPPHLALQADSSATSQAVMDVALARYASTLDIIMNMTTLDCPRRDLEAAVAVVSTLSAVSPQHLLSWADLFPAHVETFRRAIRIATFCSPTAMQLLKMLQPDAANPSSPPTFGSPQPDPASAATLVRATLDEVRLGVEVM